MKSFFNFLRAEINLSIFDLKIWNPSLLIPNCVVSSFDEIDATRLQAAGFAAIALDYDGVVVPYHTFNHPSQANIAAIKRIARHLKIVILSNRKGELLRSLVEALPDLPVIRSSKMKPHPEPYLNAAHAVRVPPEQMVLVEDRLLTGISGGNRVGMHTIWFTPALGKEYEPWNVKIYRFVEGSLLQFYQRCGLSVHSPQSFIMQREVTP